MSLPLSGEPVFINFVSTVGTTSVFLNIFYPGTSTIRVLSALEQLTIVSLEGNLSGSQGYLLSDGAGATSATSTNLMLVFNDGGSNTVDWHDDGTYALTGRPGIVPSVLGNNGSEIWLAGTGVINQNKMATTRNPQWALLTNNSTGNF